MTLFDSNDNPTEHELNVATTLRMDKGQYHIHANPYEEPSYTLFKAEGDITEFMKRSTELVKHVKSAKPLSGQTVILPGEQGDAIAKQAEESGEIEIAEAIWNELSAFVGV